MLGRIRRARRTRTAGRRARHCASHLRAGRRPPARRDASSSCSRSTRGSARCTDVAAAAVMEDGSPVLILDVDDLIRSIEKLVARRPHRAANSAAVRAVESRTQARAGRRRFAHRARARAQAAREQRLRGRGRGRRHGRLERGAHRPFRPGVTDIDMPRMDGIELVTLIKQDPHAEVAAGDDRLVQGPRGGSAARARCRRRLLPDQGQLPRRDAAAGGASI